MIIRILIPLFAVLLSGTAMSQAPSEERVPYIRHITPEGMPKAPHFSRVVMATATKTIYVAGMTGSEHNMGNDVDEYEAQLREVYEKVGIALDAAGATPAHVVRQRLNIVGIRPGFAPVTRAVMEEFYNGPGPASTAVGTPGLFAPGLVVELDVTAVLNNE